MRIELAQLLKIYAKANLEFTDIHEITVPPGGRMIGKTTLGGVCGIVIPIRGRADFRVEGSTYHLEPGVILHAGSSMHLDKEVIGEDEWRFILLHYHILNKECREVLEQMHYSVSIGRNRSLDLEKLVKKLLLLVKENDSVFYELKTKTLLYNIIECFLQSMKETLLGTREESISHIVEVIHQNLDQNISIQQLADKVELDAKQFHYLFQKNIGLCPKQYIIQQRMKRAKELLETENYTVATIASMVGYEDPLHFSRMFKKYTGHSPSLYREEIEKNPWRF
jgi:AraC-like DNA-binding protein